MGKKKTIRFCVGTPEEPFSGVWRLVTNGNDVYLGASGQSMGIFKVSLHQSGVWTLAATKQSGATFQDGNRRAKKWNRPLEHAKGITRGPSIIVPRTSLGSRKIAAKEKGKNAIWFDTPGEGEHVEFSIYFVSEHASTKWNADEVEIANIGTKSGDRVILLASKKRSPKDFIGTCEKLLRDNVFGVDKLEGIIESSFLWICESRDELSIPLLVDMPLAFRKQET